MVAKLQRTGYFIVMCSRLFFFSLSWYFTSLISLCSHQKELEKIILLKGYALIISSQVKMLSTTLCKYLRDVTSINVAISQIWSYFGSNRILDWTLTLSFLYPKTSVLLKSILPLYISFLLNKFQMHDCRRTMCIFTVDNSVLDLFQTLFPETKINKVNSPNC